ncbi:MAG TPA: hypothetical protein VEC18_06205, partial [Myxococcota bacterium]|nr:hypothetical protein [Myxococcota bacterium]
MRPRLRRAARRRGARSRGTRVRARRASRVKHRRPEIGFSDAERGTCRWCGELILHESGAKRGARDRRRRWHPACVAVYEASDPRELRRR